MKPITKYIESVQRNAVRWITNNWVRCSSPTKMLEELEGKKIAREDVNCKIENGL